MHRHDPASEVLTEAIVRYAVDRVRLDPPPLDHPRTAAELRAMAGRTITPGGLGGLEALRVFADVLAPYPYAKANFGKIYEFPSREFPLGTDQLGRDYFSRVIYGVQTSLGVAIVVALLATLLGTLVGVAIGLGVAALVVPEELGGAGGELADAAVVLEELGKGLVPTPLFGTTLAELQAQLAAPPAPQPEAAH